MKITISLEVSAQQAQYIAAVAHCWETDVATDVNFDEYPLMPLNEFIFNLAYKLWADDTGLFSGGVDGGVISHEFYNLWENNKDVRCLWNLRTALFSDTLPWEMVKDRMEELLRPDSVT